jgi:hypothetical protein
MLLALFGKPNPPTSSPSLRFSGREGGTEKPLPYEERGWGGLIDQQYP